MTARPARLTRRQYLAATGAAALASGLGARSAFALELVRQGYQTNIWGMPTYYLMRSGLLEKRGIKFQEFAVPSGNLTMQQMVARQVDLGTYAGQSFTIGHDKGGLVAIAQIEYVGKTAQIVVRKDLNVTKVEQLKGLKVANQTGSSVGNIFVDIIAQNAGLKKGDFQEVRMNVNDMIAAMAAKTVDAMVNVEPYNEIAVAEGIGTSIMDFSSVDRMPVFMAATPDFVDKNPDTVIAYLKCWQEVAKDFKDQPEQGRGRDLFVLHLEGLQHVARHLYQGAGARRGQSGIPARPAEAAPEGRRSAAAGKEDLRHPGLEESAASRPVGEGQRISIQARASFPCSNRRAGRTGRSTSPPPPQAKEGAHRRCRAFRWHTRSRAMPPPAFPSPGETR